MIFPALGIIIAGVVAVGSAVGTAAIFRSRTGHWRPVASAVLALLPALCFWPPVFMGLPAAFSRFTVLGPVGSA